MTPVADDINVIIILPTAINVVLWVNDNVTTNLRRAKASDVGLPDLYQRALLVVNETDEVGILRTTAGQ